MLESGGKLPCLCYALRDRFYNDSRPFDEVIQAPTGDMVAARVYSDRSFQEISG
jgi:hypothetical protein